MCLAFIFYEMIFCRFCFLCTPLTESHIIIIVVIFCFWFLLIATSLKSSWIVFREHVHRLLLLLYESFLLILEFLLIEFFIDFRQRPNSMLNWGANRYNRYKPITDAESGFKGSVMTSLNLNVFRTRNMNYVIVVINYCYSQQVSDNVHICISREYDPIKHHTIPIIIIISRDANKIRERNLVLVPIIPNCYRLSHTLIK